MAVRLTVVFLLLLVTSASEFPLVLLPHSLAGCRGTIAECQLAAGVELDLGTEVSRRFLEGTNYISYGALTRDKTPCSQSGASYYNCKPGAKANPYTRSCSAIDNCRSK